MMHWTDDTWEDSPIRRSIGFDDVSGKIVSAMRQDNINECIEFNRALYNADRQSSSLWNGANYVKVAAVPLFLIERWAREGVNYFRWNEDDKAAFKCKINDRDYSDFRCASGVF